MSLEENKYHLTMQVPQINSLQDLQASEGCSPSAEWRRGGHFCGSENQGNMKCSRFSGSPTQTFPSYDSTFQSFPVSMLTLLEEIIEAVSSISFAALPPLLFGLDCQHRLPTSMDEIFLKGCYRGTLAFTTCLDLNS